MPFDLEADDQPIASERGDDGRFRPGNTAAMTHGLRSARLQQGALLPPGAALPADRERAILADMGGPENVSSVATGLVRRYAHLELIAEWLEGNLLAEGVLTTKGRQRASVATYAAVVDRLTRLGTTLGLERKARRVQNGAEYFKTL
jgi:hypothetical protein